MNTKEVNNPLCELKLNQSVPQILLKINAKEKVSSGNSYLVISGRSRYNSSCELC